MIAIRSLKTFTFAEEGLISDDGLGEGRMIPALVLEVGKNKDIVELIQLHKSIPNAEADITWVLDPFHRKNFILRLSFQKPIQIQFGIRFDIDKDAVLIDGIIQSKGLCLMTGKKGDKVSKKMKYGSLLIEVPDTGVKGRWDKMHLTSVVKRFRKKGLTKNEAKDAAKEHISSIKELWKLRRNQ